MKICLERVSGEAYCGQPLAVACRPMGAVLAANIMDTTCRGCQRVHAAESAVKDALRRVRKAKLSARGAVRKRLGSAAVVLEDVVHRLLVTNDLLF